jgi:hypothetical protein
MPKAGRWPYYFVISDVQYSTIHMAKDDSSFIASDMTEAKQHYVAEEQWKN